MTDPTWRDDEDEYDRQCLDTALAEPSNPVPFREFLADLGITPEDLGQPDAPDA